VEQGQSTILLLCFIQPVHIQLLLKLGMSLLKALLHFNHSVVQSSASFLGTDSLRKQLFLLAPHRWGHFKDSEEKRLFLQANGLKLCDLE